MLMMKYTIPFGALAVPNKTTAIPRTAITAIIFFINELREKSFRLKSWNKPKIKHRLPGK